MAEHAWDMITHYCRACGAARTGVVEGARPVECEGGGNLVAISVTRARRCLVEIGLDIFEPPRGRK